jgi:hypothetical protein
MDWQSTALEMQEVTDANELAKARSQCERFDRNRTWLQNIVSDIHAKHPGKCDCVAGQEVFFSDTVRDVIAQATVAHPNDEGWFARYVSREKAARVYAV